MAVSVLSAAEVRDALARRVVDLAGLREATSVLGPELEPTYIVDGTFSILWDEAVATEERQRSGDLLHPRQRFTVRVAHKLNPQAKAESVNAALNAGRNVRNALLSDRSDVLQPIHNTLFWRSSGRPRPLADGVRLVDHVFDIQLEELIGSDITTPPIVNPTG